MPSSWPLTWPGSTVAGCPCWIRPATSSSSATARPSPRVRAGCRCNIVTGTVAFGPVQLHVGPGVFIPRPETESILEWVTAQQLGARPVIVDLCTGSGALAVALAHHRPAARIIGIDDSDAALDYARRNTEGTAVELVRADVTAEGLLPELDGQVDVVVANPPYVPDAC